MQSNKSYKIQWLARSNSCYDRYFWPSFLFVALLNPIIPKLKKSKIMAVFLEAVNAASIAIILSICVEMGRDSIQDWRTIVIALISLVVTFIYRTLNTAFIVVGGGLLGYILYWVP